MHDILTILLPVVVTQVIVLVIMIFVMKRLLLSDTMQAVNRIRQVEAEVRKREETIRKEIEEHEKEFARKKVEAEEELGRQREASEKEVSKLREQMIADARKEGDTIIEQARKNEDKFRKQIAQDMEEKTVDYGAQVFKLVMSEQMNDVMNHQFISELLDAIQEIDSSSITVDTANAEFRSSHPIGAEQKERLEKLLAEKFNARIKVSEKVDPDLMAGLVFKMGSLEIDGSLLNRFQEAAGELKKTVIG